jgi:hypothetical protein
VNELPEESLEKNGRRAAPEGAAENKGLGVAEEATETNEVEPEGWNSEEIGVYEE